MRAILQYAKLALFALGFAGVHTLLHTQPSNAETINGSAHAQILELIQISEVRSLDFGIILTNNGLADTISINTDGSLTTGTSSSHVGSTVQSGQFTTNGTPNSTLTISFQDAVLSGGGSTMTMTNFTHNAGATPSLDASGILVFNVGADLSISDGQPIGDYSGSYQITINYQ